MDDQSVAEVVAGLAVVAIGAACLNEMMALAILAAAAAADCLALNPGSNPACLAGCDFGAQAAAAADLMEPDYHRAAAGSFDASVASAGAAVVGHGGSEAGQSAAGAFGSAAAAVLVAVSECCLAVPYWDFLEPVGAADHRSENQSPDFVVVVAAAVAAASSCVALALDAALGSAGGSGRNRTKYSAKEPDSSGCHSHMQATIGSLMAHV